MRSSAAYFTLSLAARAFFSAAVVLSVRCAPLLFRARSLKLHRDGGRARAPETHRWLLRAHQNCPSCSSGKFGHFDFLCTHAAAGTPLENALARTLNVSLLQKRRVDEHFCFRKLVCTQFSTSCLRWNFYIRLFFAAFQCMWTERD
jgi:hypothetical protein